MIDNFNSLADYLSSNDKSLTADNFYFCQIIRRNKDFPTGRNHKTIRDFYIKNSQDLLAKKEEIVEFCNHFGARAYLNPNVKSYRKCALDNLKCLAENISNENYSAKGLFSSAAGKVSTRDTKFDKVWIVDYDYGDIEEIEIYLVYKEIPYHAMDTKNGLHFLTKPFDLRNCSFSDKIKKHNPTLLYYGG